MLKIHVQNKSRMFETQKASLRIASSNTLLEIGTVKVKTNLTRDPFQQPEESTFYCQIKQARNSLIRSTPNLTARILNKSARILNNSARILNKTARILNKTARSDVRALPRVQKWPSLDAYTTTSNHVIELCPGIVQDTI